MHQITLRQLPEKLDREIRKLAKKSDMSLNRTIIALLHKALNIPEQSNKKRDLSDLAGRWSEGEAEEFETNIKLFEEIDPQMWES